VDNALLNPPEVDQFLLTNKYIIIYIILTIIGWWDFQVFYLNAVEFGAEIENDLSHTHLRFAPFVLAEFHQLGGDGTDRVSQSIAKNNFHSNRPATFT